MVSQQTICGDPENIEIANDTEPKLTQSKEHMEIEQTRKNLMETWEVYFKYLSSQRMAHTKSSLRRGVMDGKKIHSTNPTFNHPVRSTMNTPIWGGYQKDPKRQDPKILTWNQGAERNLEISKVNQACDS